MPPGASADRPRHTDLLDATPRRIWLQRLLGHPGYAHLPLALDASRTQAVQQERACAVVAAIPCRAARRSLSWAWTRTGRRRRVTQMLRRAIGTSIFTRIRAPARLCRSRFVALV